MNSEEIRKELAEISNFIKSEEKKLAAIARQLAKTCERLESVSRKANAVALISANVTASRMQAGTISEKQLSRLRQKEHADSLRTSIKSQQIRDFISELNDEKRLIEKEISKKRLCFNALTRKLKTQERREKAGPKGNPLKPGGKLSEFPPKRSVYSWDDAEHLAWEYMLWLGYCDAKRTRSGSDDGIDIASKQAYAQVKAHMKQTPVGDVQRHFGVSVADSRFPIFFAMSYSKSAITWAEKRAMALFVFNRRGEVVAISECAEALLRQRREQK